MGFPFGHNFTFEKKFGMTTVLNAPLHSVNQSEFLHLRERYPEAVVRVEVEMPGQASEMDERNFWAILSTLDWGRKNSADVLAPAVHALSQFSEADIARFDDLLAQKLFALDGSTFAEGYQNTRPANGFSVDGFLYARCGVVANGKHFYEKTLKNAHLLSADLSFEPLLYLAEKAHELKTGSTDYDHLPALSWETFSNQSAWPGQPSWQQTLTRDFG